MLRLKNIKPNAVLVVAVFAIAMTLGPAISNFQTAFAHYGVDIDQCKDDEDYYEDNEEACDKNLRAHYDDDYDGDFGSKSIDDDNDDHDDHDDHDDNNGNGNSASQGIGQSQSSSQNSQCVSGDDTNDSCNNVSVQNQDNDGNNAAAQDGGNGKKGKGGNDADQGIGQDQDSEQNSQCVSGEDATVSCNNVSFQNQVNSGNNALAQD
jgi:hypothetical protein